MDSSQRFHKDKHGAYHRESQENWAQSPMDSSFCKWLKPRRHVPKTSASPTTHLRCGRLCRFGLRHSADVLGGAACSVLTTLPRSGKYVITGNDPEKPRADSRPWFA